MVRVLLLNGVNLNWLGRRQPQLYGSRSWQGGGADLRRAFPHVELIERHSHSEGELIGILQWAEDNVDGVVFNPGAYAHTSLALADALACMSIPVVEVHITNVFAREPERHRLLTGARARTVIVGGGVMVYRLGVEAVLHFLGER